MRSAGATLIAIALSGCIGFGGCTVSFPPLAIERTGQLLEDARGGPPVECRGLAIDYCDAGFHVVRQARLPFDAAAVERVVVSCVGTCSPRGGEMRIDVVLDDGTSQLYSNSGYGEFKQSCA